MKIDHTENAAMAVTGSAFGLEATQRPQNNTSFVAHRRLLISPIQS